MSVEFNGFIRVFVITAYVLFRKYGLSRFVVIPQRLLGRFVAVGVFALVLDDALFVLYRNV